MQVVLRIKEQAGHQGGPLLTQPTLSHFFSLGPPDLTVPSSVTNGIMQRVRESEK